MIFQTMLFQSPISLSITNKIMIKLFLQPLKMVQSIIHLKSFMGAADPHNCYVIQIEMRFQRTCKNELCSGVTTLCATHKSIKLKKLSLNIFIGKALEITLHMMYPRVVYVKNKRNSAKSMDYSQKRKLNINHGNGYVSISLVLTKYEQRNKIVELIRCSLTSHRCVDHTELWAIKSTIEGPPHLGLVPYS